MNPPKEQTAKKRVYAGRRFPRPPLFKLLDEDGRAYSWLARRMGVSPSLMFAVSCGVRNPSAKFRRRAAEVLGRSEAELFVMPSPSPADPASEPANAA